jgi:hypothetical protein
MHAIFARRLGVAATVREVWVRTATSIDGVASGGEAVVTGGLHSVVRH